MSDWTDRLAETLEVARLDAGQQGAPDASQIEGR